MSAITLSGALELIACLAIGLAVGGVYFVAMWWSAQLFATGAPAPLAAALVMSRFALIVLALALVAMRGGAWPLLATALGIVIARTAALRGVKAMPQ